MSNINISVDSVSGEGSLLGLLTAAFSLCLYLVFPWYVHVEGKRQPSGVSSDKNTNPNRPQSHSYDLM